MALAAFYGKSVKPDLNYAFKYAMQANAQEAKDNSSRVCGLATFVAYRAKQKDVAIETSKNCPSKLVSILQSYNPKDLDDEIINVYEATIDTGIDDAFDELEKHAKRSLKDERYYSCRFTIMNRYRWKYFEADKAPIKAFAKSCFESHPYTKKPEIG